MIDWNFYVTLLKCEHFKLNITEFYNKSNEVMSIELQSTFLFSFAYIYSVQCPLG